MRITLVIRTFIIAFLLFTSSVCFAANHYIRAGATGSNNGSDWTNAYLSFASIVWTRGDTYYVAGGTYNENVTAGKAESGSSWIIIKKANAADNSGDAGWNSSFASTQAVINGQLTLYPGGYIEVDGVTGSGNSGHGIKVYQATGRKGIELDYKSFYYIHHVEIEGSGFVADHDTDGIYAFSTSQAKGLHISNCYIHNISRQGVTITNRAGTSFSDYGFLYENNYMEEIGGTQVPGSHAQGIMLNMYSAGSYYIIRNSIFKNIVGSGYIDTLGCSGATCTSTSYLDIYNNIFQSTDRVTYWSSPGVIWFREAASSGYQTTATDIKIYNNTFYNITKNQIAINADIVANNEVKNNLFHTGNFTTGHTGIASSQYNAFYNCDGAGVPSGETGQQNETSDPVVNSAAYDFQLKYTARAKDHGIDLSSIFSTDILGKRRPSGSGWDIGAYAYYGYGPKPPMNLRIK